MVHLERSRSALRGTQAIACLKWPGLFNALKEEIMIFFID